MKGDLLPIEDHVSRYCSPTRVEDERPLASAFLIQPDRNYLSVNWLEYWHSGSIEEALARVRGETELEVKPEGRFAVLLVGAIVGAINRVTGREAQVVHKPTTTVESHSGVFGYSPDEREVAAEIASTVGSNNVFPSIVPED